MADLYNPLAGVRGTGLTYNDLLASRPGTRDADPVIAGLARSFEITHLFRSDSGGGLFEAGPIELTDHQDDSRPGGALPVGLMAPSIAVRLEHQAGERFELSALVYHFDNLGVT